MNGWKNILVTFGFVLSVSLIASTLTATLASDHYNRVQFDLLNTICGEILAQEPETKQMIAAALKEYTRQEIDSNAETDILSSLGYRISDLTAPDYRQNILFTSAGFLAGILLFILTFLYRNHKEALRIRALADYLEQVNMGKAVILSTSGEDNFAKLEDEIYKTVTYLYQTKDSAVQAKKDFAQNLSNIAHQIKTPITAISLSLQMMKQNFDNRHLEKIEKQLLRITHLEESLLILSRLDAGTLPLQKTETDVFT
ncbi:MAG: sensor histidine kinase, partial [Lachnospiraceae bacterium]|nr:sensor histidine kinase [Lachnospiraceae bacterium]